jgi:hypothetical protein
MLHSFDRSALNAVYHLRDAKWKWNMDILPSFRFHKSCQQSAGLLQDWRNRSILTVLTGTTSAGSIGIILFLQVLCLTGFFPLTFVANARLSGKEGMGMAMGISMPIITLCGVGVVPYLLGLSGDLASFRVGIIIILGILVTLSSGLVLLLKELK